MLSPQLRLSSLSAHPLASCMMIPSLPHFLAEDTRHCIDSRCNVEADRTLRVDSTNPFVCYHCSNICPRVSDSNSTSSQHLYHRPHIDDPCISHPIDNLRRDAHEYIETPRPFSHEASVHKTRPQPGSVSHTKHHHNPPSCIPPTSAPTSYFPALWTCHPQNGFSGFITPRASDGGRV
jgi:hypothetical protein